MDSNDFGRLDRIEPGWDVFGSDDQKIGSVQEVDARSISVEKGLFFVKDLYVPVSAVQEVDPRERRITLNVAKDAVGAMGWTEPAITEPGEVRQTWGQGDDVTATATGRTVDVPADPFLRREPVLDDDEAPEVRPGSAIDRTG